MNITRASQSAARRGSADYFTGTVWLDNVTAEPSESDVYAVMVTFEPGARTAWHTHPNGQLLRVISGVGRAQKAGEEIVEILPGDTIWFEPGERHWHGAAPYHTMTHLAVQRADATGKAAAWLEAVSDIEYIGSLARSTP